VTGRVVIDALPEHAVQYRGTHAIVAVDAFRATTTIVTAVADGRRVFPVVSVEEASKVAAGLSDPLLAGELAGERPPNFEVNNSPYRLSGRSDRRPLVLLSSAGTQLLACARGSIATYVACFRNLTATADYVASRHERVAVIGAGTRGELRLEDQLACAWIALRLTEQGFQPADAMTRHEIDRWAAADISLINDGPSAEYLRSSGQEDDIGYVLSHVDDLNLVVVMDGQEAMLVDDHVPALSKGEL